MVSSMLKLTHKDVRNLARDVAHKINNQLMTPQTSLNIYAVPRGGIPAALALIPFLSTRFRARLVEDPKMADFVFDDIIDTGRTREQYLGHKFFALIDKIKDDRYKGLWVVFPWEETQERGYEDHVVRLLQYVGEDPNRGGLRETPARVSKAWQHWCSGYSKKPEDILKVFEDGGESYDQMVTVQDIPIYSHCEHHLAPIFGTATISYIPDGKIVGLSKLSRLADMFARRLQVQERMTSQIAHSLQSILKPHGVGVCIKARHLCMESRGICQQGHQTITTALTGHMLNEPSARAEFLQLVR
jgi:GTP cyclohydrolase I